MKPEYCPYCITVCITELDTLDISSATHDIKALTEYKCDRCQGTFWCELELKETK